jgi:gamma-glutamyl phosphate reductase
MHKVADIVKMIRATAQQEDPVGKCTSKLEVMSFQI